MSDTSRAVRVGLMAIVLTIAVIVGYRFISRSTGTGGGYMVWAYMPDMTGVAPQSRVMISGIQVGVVDRIWLDDGKARVDIKMKPEVHLYKDAAIGKRATSLIGEYYIVLTPGTEGTERIPDGGQILNYIEEPSLQSLQGQVSEILKDVKAVTESLKNTVGSDKGQEQIAQVLKNLAEITEELNKTVKENREAVKGTIANVNQMTGDARPQLKEILENIRQVTADVREFTQKSPDPNGKPGEVRSALERIDRASASLESTLKSADNIAARIDRGEGTVGRLVKDETLINEVETVVQDVGDLVGGISRLQTVVGLRTDYNFLRNTVKTYVELRLQPAVDKYYMVQLVNDPRGKTSIEQTTVDTTNPNEPSSYRETRVTTSNDFRISFQFAKRFDLSRDPSVALTGRFGILESTGGIGLDLHLIDDRFELSQDLFGFGEQLIPRWRITIGYEFIDQLWLLGGVDDILRDEGRDYFVGLQLRFTDNDLKSMLPLAGAAAP